MTARIMPPAILSMSVSFDKTEHSGIFSNVQAASALHRRVALPTLGFLAALGVGTDVFKEISDNYGWVEFHRLTYRSLRKTRDASKRDWTAVMSDGSSAESTIYHLQLSSNYVAP